MRSPKLDVRRFFFGLSLALALLHGHPAMALPKTMDTQFTDTSRDRIIPLKIRVPDGIDKRPLVIFSHGLGGSREGGVVWGEHWAANGYFVIHLQHAGSDLELLKKGFGSPLQKLKRGATGAQLIARTQDVSFVIDELIRRQQRNESDFDRIDLTKIAMTGHSFGASTTMALADQRFPDSDRSLADSRIKAFIAFSPQVSGEEQNKIVEHYKKVNRPLLVVTGTLDGDMIGNGANAERRSRVYDVLPGPEKYRVVFANGDHMVFNGGATNESATFLQFIENKSTRTDQSTASLIHEKGSFLTLKFLDAHVKSDLASKLWLKREANNFLGVSASWSFEAK